MTGFQVEKVFAMAAKDMYVRQVMNQADEEETQNVPAATKNKRTSSVSGSKDTVDLGRDKGKSLADKKKDKGCC